MSPLDETAALSANVTEHDPRRAVLARLVDELEAAASAGWGAAGTRTPDEPVVVLQRRLDRARRLLGAPSPELSQRLAVIAAALRDPAGALLASWSANEDLRVLDTPPRRVADAQVSSAGAGGC